MGARVTAGKGGFGEVFKVQNLLDNNFYAIKKIRLSLFPGNENYLERILGEVRLFSKLNHPNIVRYFQAWIEDVDPTDVTVNFSEDFLYGESLDETSRTPSRPG